MERADKNLAFMLQYENIAWYEDGTVRILDRRIYPHKIEFLICRTHHEVAQAIRDMVTQSAGPYTAAAMGMALAAYECREMAAEKKRQYLNNAAWELSHARPTTVSRMEGVVSGCLEAAASALESSGCAAEAVKTHAVEACNKRYRKVGQIADNLIRLFPKKGTVMTQCFAETIVGMMLRAAKEQKRELCFFCPETRPYFQGARLTATVVRDMGFPVTVITDNMPAYVMEREHIDVFTSAADCITLDGHVVNKIGTFQIAIAAKYLGIPYFVTGVPDAAHKDKASVTIELRDPEFTLQAMGVRTAADEVCGYYPAFDMTPPHLISGVVTPIGVFSPYDISDYYEKAGTDPRELVL